jgi:hypothetical protein
MRVVHRDHRLGIFTVLAISATFALAAQGLAATAATGPSPARGKIVPHAFGMLDCNGLSPIQRPVKQGLPCAEPRGPDAGRFSDNGHYIGHDEPSVRFISSRRGSGNNVTFTERLPVDPAARPTTARPGHDVTHWFELSVAPWFSTDVCDPFSAPLLPCKPHSDANAPRRRYPGAGAAFVELQFYPPGSAPFDDNISCDNTHWCSALNIDSLECKGTGITVGPCNNNCVEPVNFAWVQTNGIPTGPPSPQLSDRATFTPNAATLRMNPGDKIRVRLFDARIKGGRVLEAQETDLTTGQRGFMRASAGNGFADTNPFTCKGRPFSFASEYSTARPANILPWGIGPYMINSQFELGHFEPCTKITGKGTFTDGRFTDTYYKHCIGPYEAKRDSPKAFEPDDSPCYPAGDTHGGTVPPNLVTGCDVFFNAIGDLDWDGTPYWPDWPHSLRPGPFPAPFLQQQPVTAGRHRYGRLQFVTDGSASELNTGCDLRSGHGCVLPPKGPGHFYPYWTLAKVGGRCVWEFGNMGNGRVFGRDRQYGSVGPKTIGAFAGPVRRNPRC